MRTYPTLREGESGNGDGNGGGSTILSGAQAATAQATTQQTATNGNEGVSQSFDFRSAIEESGSFKAGWHESLPDDLKPYAAEFGKYPNAVELLRGHANKAKMIGQRAEVKPPGADAKPEEVAAWRKTLGVPETPEGYGLKAPEKLPEGVQWSDEQAKEFSTLAHTLNLTPDQAQKLVEYDLKRVASIQAKGQENIQAYLQAQSKELSDKWGEKMQENTAKALAAAQLLGLDPKDPEIGNSAKMIQALHAASLLIKEDKLLGSGNSSGLTNVQQAEDIRRNPNNPWYKAYQGLEGTARQQEAEAFMRRLNGIPDSAAKSM